mgnify:CR=1 FL=1
MSKCKFFKLHFQVKLITINSKWKNVNNIYQNETENVKKCLFFKSHFQVQFITINSK